MSTLLIVLLAAAAGVALLACLAAVSMFATAQKEKLHGPNAADNWSAAPEGCPVADSDGGDGD